MYNHGAYASGGRARAARGNRTAEPDVGGGHPVSPDRGGSGAKPL